jgi:shikimate dehydrogenase
MRVMAAVITLCGSLSKLASPLGRSMHEAGYRALGLSFAYVPFEVVDLRRAIEGMRGLGIRGFGVSHPFKQEVIPLLDALHPVAERIGAVNTIVNDRATGLVGHNTDWVGAVRALEEAIASKSSVPPLDRSRVLLVGSGGAARAIAFGLRERGARATIANRDEAKARALAAETGSMAAPLAETRRAAEYDIVVNATTLGQTDVGAEGPVPAEALRAGQVVMDIVYKPVRTRLIEAASARGALAVHGGRMLLYQAAAQFELYTGRNAPLDAMDQALRAAVG